jgi:hypothetical protein
MNPKRVLLLILVMIVIFVTILVIVFSNQQKDKITEADKFFQGVHSLEAFPSFTDTIKKEHYLQVDIWANKAHIFWKNNSDEIMNVILPYDKMRFEFIPEESYDKPFIKFKWKSNNFDADKWQDQIIYYIIGIKKSWIVS